MTQHNANINNDIEKGSSLMSSQQYCGMAALFIQPGIETRNFSCGGVYFSSSIFEPANRRRITFRLRIFASTNDSLDIRDHIYLFYLH